MFGPETKFIVADGDAGTARTIENLLNRNGFPNVTLVHDGRSALKLIKHFPEFLLIVSWDLPDIPGLNIVDELRHNRKVKDMPCLLIGSPRNKEDVPRARQLGVNGIILGGLKEDSLWQRIQRVLDNPDEKIPWPVQQESQAQISADAGDFQDAIIHYEGILESAKKRTAGLHTEIGTILIAKGETGEAVQHLEQAVRDDPDSPRSLAALGQAYLQQERGEDALGVLTKARHLDPYNLETQLLLGESLLICGREEKAEELFESLLPRINEDPHYFNRLAVALRKSGQYEKALAIYLKTLQIEGRDEHLYFNLGRCFMEAGMITKAAAALKKALAINPDLDEAKRLLSAIRRKLSVGNQ